MPLSDMRLSQVQPQLLGNCDHGIPRGHVHQLILSLAAVLRVFSCLAVDWLLFCCLSAVWLLSCAETCLALWLLFCCLAALWLQFCSLGAVFAVWLLSGCCFAVWLLSGCCVAVWLLSGCLAAVWLSFFLSVYISFFLSSFLPFFLCYSFLFFLILLSSVLPSLLLGPFSVKHFAYAASAVLCLIGQVVMVQQRSWKLYDDWKEVAQSRSSYRSQKSSNNKSGYGWKWKSWTACQFEGCRGWVYDHQKCSFCPQCIRPLPEPA